MYMYTVLWYADVCAGVPPSSGGAFLWEWAEATDKDRQWAAPPWTTARSVFQLWLHCVICHGLAVFSPNTYKAILTRQYYAFRADISLMWEKGQAQEFWCGCRLHPSYILPISLIGTIMFVLTCSTDIWSSPLWRLTPYCCSYVYIFIFLSRR